MECDVSDLVPVPGEHLLRGTAYAPDELDPAAPPAVVWCLPGGRCTIDYFDLRVEGLDGYSMVRELTHRGVLVVSLDHLGLGASSRLDDLCVVTPRVAAATHDHAVRVLTTRLRQGDLVDDLPPIAPAQLIGLGHSMGGMVVVVEQTRHDTFDAIVVLGHGADGTWAALTDDERLLMDLPDEERERAMVELARVRARGLPPDTARRAPAGSFFEPDVPRAVKRAFGAQRTELLLSCALSTMVPGVTPTPRRRASSCPCSWRSATTAPPTTSRATPPGTASKDVTLFVLPGSAHCHNQAGMCALLWSRIVAWIGVLPT